MRTVLAAIVLGFVLAPAALRAGDTGVAGNWKVTIVEDGQPVHLWLMHLEDKGGKLSGEATALKRVPASVLEEVRIQGDLLLFSVRLANKLVITFEGKLPSPGAKKILGSVSQGKVMFPAYLEATTAKNRFELDRDFVVRTPNDPRVFTIILDLLKSAKAEKAASKDVQEWVETVLKSSDAYGPRFHTDMSFKLLDALSGDFPEPAISIGRKLEAGLDAKAPLTLRMRLLEALATSLKKTGQADEAKQIMTRLDGMEKTAYVEHLKTTTEIPPEKFAGRKGKSTRGVLVELFTGAQCPPCVAADIAFDGLEKTYKTSEVVLLQYHLHIPGPDPLANADTELRQEYYGEAVGGTPAILFNGKVAAPGGGGRAAAKEKFMEYRAVVEPLLEKDATLQLTAQAVRKANKIFITANVTNLQKPGEKVRLRLALVEDWVRYKSSNGLAYHHRVVRALPGGTKGMTLAKADAELKVTVDLDDLQRHLANYMEEYASKEAPFPDSQRPLRMRNLHVVAFVQDDGNTEVLQAVDVAVAEE
jgi:hypothetical protein